MAPLDPDDDALLALNDDLPTMPDLSGSLPPPAAYADMQWDEVTQVDPLSDLNAWCI